ncbi:hypothetical protein [Actinomadura opuntiae]|uniref:hypothetical protein n=1 Tax=Actinomadura sp. OS1-43 TaxID=604315 RepID=UPI00255B35F8|nr:hypothetical protein [Actinomadura sp. OS1-43]MDL4812735.1 hypothetical protein [Actinomadura sp. OS1-43]
MAAVRGPSADRHAPGPLTKDKLHTRRQFAALEAGQHPLSLRLPEPVALHPEAAPVDDPAAGGRRCGTCRFRRLAGRGASGPKCAHEAMPVPRGATTDCRAWWPACIHHEPKEGQ